MMTGNKQERSQINISPTGLLVTGYIAGDLVLLELLCVATTTVEEPEEEKDEEGKRRGRVRYGVPSMASNALHGSAQKASQPMWTGHGKRAGYTEWSWKKPPLSPQLCRVENEEK
jgi:hypothetical protein